MHFLGCAKAEQSKCMSWIPMAGSKIPHPMTQIRDPTGTRAPRAAQKTMWYINGPEFLPVSMSLHCPVVLSPISNRYSPFKKYLSLIFLSHSLSTLLLNLGGLYESVCTSLMFGKLQFRLVMETKCCIYLPQVRSKCLPDTAVTSIQRGHIYLEKQ